MHRKYTLLARRAATHLTAPSLTVARAKWYVPLGMTWACASGEITGRDLSATTAPVLAALAPMPHSGPRIALDHHGSTLVAMWPGPRVA